MQKHYDWDGVVDQYEQLFQRMSGQAVATEAIAAEPEKVKVLEESARK